MVDPFLLFWPMKNHMTEMSLFPDADLAALSVLFRPVSLVVLSSIVCATGISIISLRFKGVWFINLRNLFFYSFPIGLLAYASGYLTGISRSAAVGSVLPAVLSLFGGIGIYVFGTDNRYKGIVGYCVMIFAIALLYGTQIGALQNQIGAEERLKLLSDQERKIRNYRYNLELQEDPPSWIVPGAKAD